MKRKHFFKLTLFPLVLSLFIITGSSCSKDDEDNKELKIEEQDRYNEIVTPLMEDVLLNKLGATIYRGINPPNIEGFYRAEIFCEKSTIKNDKMLGTIPVNHKMNFYNQRGFSIDMKSFEVVKNTDIFATKHESEGTFISGEGDNFSIFLDEKVYAPGRDHIFFTVFSGQLDRNEKGEVIGIKNHQYAIIMKESYGNATLIANGEGRLFTDDYVKVISEADFNKTKEKSTTEILDTLFTLGSAIQ